MHVQGKKNLNKLVKKMLDSCWVLDQLKLTRMCFHQRFKRFSRLHISVKSLCFFLWRWMFSMIFPASPSEQSDTSTSFDPFTSHDSESSSLSLCQTGLLAVLLRLKAVFVTTAAAVPEANASPVIVVKEPHLCVLLAAAGVLSEQAGSWKTTAERFTC